MAQIWITPTLILQNTGSSTDLKTKFLVTRYPTSFINNMISLEVKFCKILRISLRNNAFAPKNIHRKKLKNSKSIFFLYQKCLSPNMCWIDDIIWPMYEKQFCILIYVTSDYSFRSIVENPQQILRPTPHLAQLRWQWCRIKKIVKYTRNKYIKRLVPIHYLGFLAKNPEYNGSEYFYYFPN